MNIMAVLIAALLCSLPAVGADIEEPSWQLVDQFDSVELRYYEPSIQAKTTLADSAGSSAGFRRLAGFIFGGNSNSQKIAMTAPVQEMLVEEYPTMAFTLPGEYSFEELPQPDDPRVSLEEVPARTMAVIRVSGWASGAVVTRKTDELLASLRERTIEVIGTPSLNQYNPPWTLPFLRRNEIMVEVVSSKFSAAAL